MHAWTSTLLNWPLPLPPITSTIQRIAKPIPIVIVNPGAEFLSWAALMPTTPAFHLPVVTPAMRANASITTAASSNLTEQ
jgi:hypothetical protein